MIDDPRQYDLLVRISQISSWRRKRAGILTSSNQFLICLKIGEQSALDTDTITHIMDLELMTNSAWDTGSNEFLLQNMDQ